MDNNKGQINMYISICVVCTSVLVCMRETELDTERDEFNIPAMIMQVDTKS